MSASRDEQGLSKDKRRRSRHRNLVAKNAVKFYSSHALKDVRAYNRSKQKKEELEDY
jgi:hypothetical protein